MLAMRDKGTWMLLLLSRSLSKAVTMVKKQVLDPSGDQAPNSDSTNYELNLLQAGVQTMRCDNTSKNTRGWFNQ